MKITALETIRIAERPNLIWVQIHTDEGLVGLGETFFGAAAVEGHVHEYIGPRVIGRDPAQRCRGCGDRGAGPGDACRAGQPGAVDGA